MSERLDWCYGAKAISNCVLCKHFKGSKRSKMICDAFPKGIPLEIWLEKVKHDQPYDGDRGIQFEK